MQKGRGTPVHDEGDPAILLIRSSKSGTRAQAATGIELTTRAEWSPDWKPRTRHLETLGGRVERGRPGPGGLHRVGLGPGRTDSFVQ
ncbi:hypothetical protein ACYOEI_29395 [Singulisphaera rosea]